MGVDIRAREEQATFYDERYGRGYMQDFRDFYEACRVRSLRSSLQRLALQPSSVLDYGSGEGRLADDWLLEWRWTGTGDLAEAGWKLAGVRFH